jgi:hypothetical protein
MGLTLISDIRIDYFFVNLILRFVETRFVVRVAGSRGDALADGGVDAERLRDFVGDRLEGVCGLVVDRDGCFAALCTHCAAGLGGGRERGLSVDDLKATNLEIDDDGSSALVGNGPAELINNALDSHGDLLLGALLGVLEGALDPVELLGDDVLMEDRETDRVQIELADELLREVEIEVAFVAHGEGGEQRDFDGFLITADDLRDVTVESVEDIREIDFERSSAGLLGGLVPLLRRLGDEIFATINPFFQRNSISSSLV